ncbi:ankyrin repeat domain-containing protein [bacterium]|nr:ankyrin repeat domain-containing protein [bacterium]MDA7680001.1 ankyrin repeat domain-containing protein [bacterium]
MKKLLIIIGVTIGLNTSIVAGPIHDAASAGDIEEIKSLLNIGVSVEHKSGGWTALHYAIDSNQFETADFLVSIGADVNAERQDGSTPLFQSLHSTHINILNILINNGANVNHQNKAGRTPLMIPRDSQIVSVLIENGAEVDVKDFSGQTALHHRARDLRGDGEVVQILLANKADVNATDTLGKTPLDYADTNNQKVKFGLLQQAGAKSGLVLLEQKVSQLSTGTTNPTDEWPRKMWEIDLGEPIGPLNYTVGTDNAVVIRAGRDSHWVTKEGKKFRIENTSLDAGSLVYFDNKNLIYKTYANRDLSLNLLTRNNDLVALNKISIKNLQLNDLVDFGRISSAIGLSKDGTKVTAWDFTPPSSTAPKPDDGNGGGNETVNSRLIIKTAGPDIALATDGKLGAAELQKSNDLRSWRKLSDVPKEAAEVLVTPRESGNEFYRLKKK